MLTWLPRRASVRVYGYLLLICSGTGILFYDFIYYSHESTLPSLEAAWAKFLIAMLTTSVLGFLFLQADQLLDTWIHWKNHFLLRFISGLASHILLVVLLLVLLDKIVLDISQEDGLKLIILFTIAIFIYEIFYGVFYSYRYFAVTQTQQLQSERWQLELQFQSLKNQISPHYLFNCLNTVSSLLYKDTREAEEFIRRMADTFRYVLTHQRKKLVTVREELEFVKSYYFLLQVRYEYLLQLEINLPASVLDTFIPPMTLQLLVENAVKHNQISKETPLMVYISAPDNSRLQVINTKTGDTKATSGFRVGLDNIHTRYSFFSRDKVIVRDETKFSVELPVLKTSRLLPTGA